MDSERATMQRRRSSNTSGLMDGSGSSTRVRRGNSNDNNIPGPSFSSLDAGRGSSKGLTKSNLQRRSSLGVLQEEDTRRYAQDDNEDEELLSSSADELYASYEREGHAPSTAAPPHPDDTFSGPLHYLPLIVAIVPPLGAALHGRAEAWTDILILLLVAFYLYQIVRVPWEIYYASRTRRINEAEHILNDDSDSITPESIKRRRQLAQSELYQQELLSLVFCVMSPFIGSYLLYYVKSALSEPDRYINPFNVRLFVLASGVKPWSHFFRLVKNRSLFLQSEIHYPLPTVDNLKKRVANLEGALEELRRGYATKLDVKNLRDGVDVPLTQLSKAVRRNERKEEYLRLSSEERFVLLTERQEEMLNELALSAQLIERLRVEQQHMSGGILHVLKYVFSGERVMAKTQEDGHRMLWYERGPFFYMFLPLIASNRMMEATGRAIDSVSRRIRSPGGSGIMLENGSSRVTSKAVATRH